MVEVSPDTVNEAPDESEEPPVETEYQFMVPKLAEALKVTALPLQNPAAVVPVISGTVFTTIVMALDVAGEPATQAALDVNIQVTTSPLLRLEVVYVALLVPAFTPLTCHWYEGDKLFWLGVAEKVTLVPAQTAPAGLATILTPAVKALDEFKVAHTGAAGVPELKLKTLQSVL